MMGKRVNFAARTVLSPDVNLHTNQIGIPLHFAKILTFPEPVTENNLKSMQDAVLNGSSVWPGANFVEDEKGKRIALNSLQTRIALSKTLRSYSSTNPSSIKKVPHQFASVNANLIHNQVHRHLRDGDIVLVNRQPTLHKPGIMAHYVKVLKTEKTLRLHYANCATYNADFDGDEMNVHFPQVRSIVIFSNIYVLLELYCPS